MTLSTQEYIKRLELYSDKSVLWCTQELDAMADVIENALIGLLKDLSRGLAPVKDKEHALNEIKKIIKEDLSRGDVTDHSKIWQHLTGLGHNKKDAKRILSPFFTILDRKAALGLRLAKVGAILKLWMTSREHADNPQKISAFTEHLAELCGWSKDDIEAKLKVSPVTGKSA
jgi:hypothetical protein